MTSAKIIFTENIFTLLLSDINFEMNSLIGNSYVVEHQTLAGLGYCFSASLPPMLAAGALKAFEILEHDPNLVQEISRKSELLHDNFDQLKVK